MTKIEIFKAKVHYPQIASGIDEECEAMYHRVKPNNAEMMMFNETLVIMAHKEDVMALDILHEAFGFLKTKTH